MCWKLKKFKFWTFFLLNFLKKDQIRDMNYFYKETLNIIWNQQNKFFFELLIGFT